MASTNKSNVVRKSDRPQASNEGPGIVKARPRANVDERLAKRLAETTRRNDERLAKVRERERLRALERKAWASLLSRQKAERDEYRSLGLQDRIATISDENVRSSAAA